MTGAAQRSPEPPRPALILLVEDNPADVYLIEMALRSRGIEYELMAFRSGDRAIEALSAEPCAAPDLILLDLNLPGRDGFEVLQAVRAKPALVGVPTAVLTSSDASTDRYRAGIIGAERYIHKPRLLEDFVSQVGAAIAAMLG